MVFQKITIFVKTCHSDNMKFLSQTILGILLTLLPIHLFSQGVVSAASPEATKAGIAILEKGGNAIDAAVAVAFALGVTEPAMSGLGGGTQMLIAKPGEIPFCLNGSTISPAATPKDAKEEDLHFHRRSTIPSTVKVLHKAWRDYGSGKVTWAELLEPAIQYAENGFEVGEFRHLVYRKNEKELKNSPFNTQYFLLEDGSIPGVGDTIKQPVLAQTLKRLAAFGAADFYEGEIAHLIAEDMQNNGGWITLEDLRNFPEPPVVPALHSMYRSYDVYSQPPPCGGWTTLLALNLLENFSPEDLAADNPLRGRNILLALHMAHAVRKALPITNFADYDEQVEQRLNKTFARELLHTGLPIDTELNNDKGGETTHFTLVDNGGMVVAVTASINAYFGAKAASEKLGFLYNTYMDDFTTENPDHPFAIGPGLQNYSSMSPVIVQQDGQSVFALGSPGSARIISAVAQLAALWIDQHPPAEQLLAVPRFHSQDLKVFYEKQPVSSEDRAFWRAAKFEIAYPTYDLSVRGLNAWFGGVHAVSFENGKWRGAADPRRDGIVLYSNQ